jgi:N-dimethylarginine dimethylaminohydrolase
MSQTALEGLSPLNQHKLADIGFRIHGVELDELEKAGGSLRCLIAEIY